MDKDVCTIEELDLSQNTLWWSHNTAEIVADLIERQHKLEKLALMTEQIPFYRAKTIREATK